MPKSANEFYIHKNSFKTVAITMSILILYFFNNISMLVFKYPHFCSGSFIRMNEISKRFIYIHSFIHSICTTFFLPPTKYGQGSIKLSTIIYAAHSSLLLHFFSSVSLLFSFNQSLYRADEKKIF